jgi:hypothetical protein
MSDFVVKPHFGGFVLTNIGVARIEGMTMFPLVEHAHLCRWDELRAIKNLWEKQSADPKRTYHSFTDWIASLLSDPTIPESIKQKISHISDNS